MYGCESAQWRHEGALAVQRAAHERGSTRPSWNSCICTEQTRVPAFQPLRPRRAESKGSFAQEQFVPHPLQDGQAFSKRGKPITRKYTSTRSTDSRILSLWKSAARLSANRRSEAASSCPKTWCAPLTVAITTLALATP